MKIGKFSGGMAVIAVILSLTAPAQADKLDCSLQSARRSAPPPVTLRSDGGFRIFWHVATKIEELADAKPASMQEIRATQKLVDGYYFNVLLRGPLAYWPGRPEACEVNKKMRTKETARSCNAKRKEMLSKLGYSSEGELQVDSLARAAKVLDLSREQSRGKLVMSEMLLDEDAMSYDPKTDSIKLAEVPRTLCALNRIAITPNAFMVYQEPAIQVGAGNFVWIPRKIDGRVTKSENPKADKIPENSRVFNMLDDSFEKAGIPVANMFPNIRAWKATTPELAEQLSSMPVVGGFNFEGGPANQAERPRKILTFARGIAWTLENTKEDISILMPGYWTPDQVTSEAGIDTLPARLRNYILAINQNLSRLTGRKNAICNGRIILVPGSYGRPVHVDTLPAKRNGGYAGTVTGEIHMLADLRKELCS
jgi:hypothetical protein